MNRLLALAFVVVLAGCAETTYQPLAPGASPVASAGAQQVGIHYERFSGLSTVQLQERRLALYQQVPRFSKRYGVANQYTTTYITHGGNLPAQDEIVLIERELNWRLSHGDKAAYFQPSAPVLPPYSQTPGS